ncbi:hypothetical protein Ade02nite_14810 [Paractinoplanes deccanensis]|uniref:Class F sortase n=1 Tax=Paractinoplanes deccanensis TaxID=113561 RepID=A0ABQ3XYW9_9ACTN|nr:class F sortase [Actinoplanes deccanensis]GID72840.1 hypothetical protein Ade02nite_14810 [Actinoplanes deccanensis]
MSSTRGASRPRPGRALLLTLTGLVLLTGYGAAACRSRPAADFGSPPASPSGPSGLSGSSGAPASRVAVRDGKPATKAAPDAPARLRVPALGLDATVDPVGVDPATGEFAVPPSVDRVGWYRYGPGLTARTGSIVIAGHVDSAEEGEGAFFRLGSLKAGDTITLTGPGERTFRVVARERYRKSAIPLDKYFARDGPARLTLITCGGPFDERTRHYRDNVVITAVPSP